MLSAPLCSGIDAFLFSPEKDVDPWTVRPSTSPRIMSTDSLMHDSSLWSRTTSIEKRQIVDMFLFPFLATPATLSLRKSSLVASQDSKVGIESSPHPPLSTKGNSSTESEISPAKDTDTTLDPTRTRSKPHTKLKERTGLLATFPRTTSPIMVETTTEERIQPSNRSPPSKQPRTQQDSVKEWAKCKGNISAASPRKDSRLGRLPFRTPSTLLPSILRTPRLSSTSISSLRCPTTTILLNHSTRARTSIPLSSRLVPDQEWLR